jgi:hypothetical protein
MRPSTFTKKYPSSVPNSNCLRNIACPHCGNRESFEIEARANFIVYDDGTSEFGDVEYDPQSRAACRSCGKTGRLERFTIPKLDETLGTISSFDAKG